MIFCFPWRVSWRWLLPLLLVTAAGAGIRFYRLDYSTIAGDESFSWRLSQYPVEELIHRTAADVHPPLYYLLLRAWNYLWGSSPLAVRSFSAFFGVLGILTVYAVCLEALAGRRGPREYSLAAHGAGLFCALLFAIHVAQVTPGRFTRMYSLGVFLAGLTAWLLLRALRCSRGRSYWWAAYGLAAAAFCYTHNYAFFTLFAQAVFFIGEILVRWRETSFKEVLAPVAGFLFAAILALVFYLPWVPILLAQMQAVRQNYWIPQLRLNEVERTFFHWGAGIGYPNVWESRLWLGAFVLAAGWVLWRADRAGWFFLLQAMVPWALALGISIASGRSIFVGRYLAFTHLSLLAFWGVLWNRLSGWLGRGLLVCLLATPCLFGLGDAVKRWPTQPPAIKAAAEFLKTHYRTGDVVVVDGAGPVNSLRCYATQAGIVPIDVRTTISPSRRSELHMSYEASLTAADILPSDRASGLSAQRVWWAGDVGSIVPDAPADKKPVWQRIFAGGKEGNYMLILYVRDE